MVSYDRGVRSGLPAYMAMPSNTRSGAEFSRRPARALRHRWSPEKKGFQVSRRVLPTDISEGRATIGARDALRSTACSATTDKLMEDPPWSSISFTIRGSTRFVGESAGGVRYRARRRKLRDRSAERRGQRMLLARRLVKWASRG